MLVLLYTFSIFLHQSRRPDLLYIFPNHLAQDNNPYAYVIRALRNTLKACLEIPNEVTSHA